MLLYVASEISKMERKKFKVHQIVEQQPDQSDKPSTSKGHNPTTSKRENPKKAVGNRKKSSRKK